MYLPIIKLCCWPQSSADQDFLCHTINEINQSVIEGIHGGGNWGQNATKIVHQRDTSMGQLPHRPDHYMTQGVSVA